MTSCLMITVTYNCDRWLPQFLDSASQVITNSPNQLAFIAVDNMSTDRTVEVLQAAFGPTMS